MATFQTLQDPFNQTSLNGSLWVPVAGSAVLSYSSPGPSAPSRPPPPPLPTARFTPLATPPTT
jgi:hypothetical protein